MKNPVTEVETEDELPLLLNRELKHETFLSTQMSYSRGETEATFTRVRTNFCSNKNVHGSTLRSRSTGGTGRIFERLRLFERQNFTDPC